METLTHLVVLAGQIEAKLRSKILPLQVQPGVGRITLIRRDPFFGEKIRWRGPPGFLSFSRPLSELWRLWAVIRVSVGERPQAIIAFGIFPNGIYAWLAGALTGIPVIVNDMGVQDRQTPYLGRFGGWLCLRAAKGAARVGVRGGPSRDWYVARGIPRERLFIPQNVYDFSAFTPDPAVPVTHDLLYVGHLARYKDLHRLLAVLSMVVVQRPQTTLLLAGDGPERGGLERQAQALGLGDRVTFCGRVDYAALPGIYRAARIFVMTSRKEGLPMAMIEAMSAGLPAVMLEAADIGEVAVQGDNALLVAPDDWPGFAAGIVRLLTDDGFYQRLRQGALRVQGRHGERFSLAHQRALWAGVLAEVIGGNS